MPQVRYKGKVYTMPWDKPDPPSIDEVKTWVKAEATRSDPNYVPPLPKLPDAEGIKLGPIPNPTEFYNSTMGGKTKSFVQGLTDTGRSIADTIDQTGRATLDKIHEGDYPGATGALASPLLGPLKRVNDAIGKAGSQSDSMSGFISNIRHNIVGDPDQAHNEAIEQAIGGTGLPAADMMTAYKSGDYPRLAGQVVSGAATIAAPHMFKGMRGEGPSRMAPPEELPHPNLDPNFNNGMGDPELAGSTPYPRGTGIVENPVIPPPKSAPTSNRGMVLPAATESTNMEPTRFVQGRAGTVDTQNIPPVDMGPNAGSYSGTLGPQEFGETVKPTSDLAPYIAENGPGIGKPVDYQQENIDRNATYGEGGIVPSGVRPSELPDISDPVAPGAPVEEAPIKDRTPPSIRQPMPGETRMAELRAKFGGQKTEPEARDTTRDLPALPAPREVDATPEQPYTRATPYQEVSRQIEQGPLQKTARQQALEAQIEKNNVPVDTETVTNAVESPVPEVAKAAQQTVAAIVKKQGFLAKSGIKPVAQDLGMSMLEKIRRMGPAGQEIYRMVSKERLDGEALAGSRTVATNDLFGKYAKDPEQFSRIQRALDTGEDPMDDGMRQAVQTYKDTIDKDIVGKAKEAGVSLRTSGGKRLEFQGRENYWPHIMPKEFFNDKQGALNALLALKDKEGNPQYSPEQANAVLKNAKMWGERLISPQHGRYADVPGYRTDYAALLQHIHDMSRRTAQASEYGPMDLADPNSKLSKLVAQTSDPAFVTKGLSRYLGRDEAGDSGMRSFVKTALKAETFLHLSQFAIGNFNNLATVPLRAGTVEAGKAFVKAFTKSGKRVAEDSGVVQSIHQEALREVGGEGILSKAFLMHKSEGFNRAVAAIAGQGTAKTLFESLKEGTISKGNKARLADLILEPIDKIEKQGELSPEQIRRAGGRMAEITQGRANSIDLPKLWTDHPATDLIFLFKKYAFRQSKIMKDALTSPTNGSVANRAKTAVLAAGILAATGELTGDVKAVLMGVPSGTSADKVANRGSEFKALGSQNAVVNRLIADYMQAWALGLVGDGLQATLKGGDNPLKFMGGPVVGDISDVASGVGALAKGNTKPLVKKAARSVPYIGPGLADEMTPVPSHGSLPSLPRMRVLPKLPRP